MRVEFTKMHGCGNDYVYIDGSRFLIPTQDKPEFVRRVSDRHFGVGSDGVIFINPSQRADFEMEMWNADGTRAEMCGNGIRCVAKYVYDKRLTDRIHLLIESAGQMKSLTLIVADGKVREVGVDMGAPVLTPEQIPVRYDKMPVTDMPLTVLEKEYRATCVSMGNPHAVIFVEDVDSLDLEKIGPYFENHEAFPNRINTEFVKVIDEHTVQMRVWERGTGETLACGTGCCATAVACVLNNLTRPEITVKVRGGEIKINYDQNADKVYMTGPAETVFEGVLEI
ncbi:MAG: diaminopimelate epimerase [Lachnospiraceae bacterium]|nr:diaminopimelate epimerase [Lachnospiraceae bacterium]